MTTLRPNRPYRVTLRTLLLLVALTPLPAWGLWLSLQPRRYGVAQVVVRANCGNRATVGAWAESQGAKKVELEDGEANWRMNNGITIAPRGDVIFFERWSKRPSKNFKAELKAVLVETERFITGHPQGKFADMALIWGTASKRGDKQDRAWQYSIEPVQLRFPNTIRWLDQSPLNLGEGRRCAKAPT